MNPLNKKEIGRTGVNVTSLGLGGGGIGGLYTLVPERQAVSTVSKALELGIKYFDTAPLYGSGKSETAIGKAISGKKQSDELTISTKVGYLISDELTSYDFTSRAVQNSFENSLHRLGLKRVDIIFIHDPVDHYRDAITEAYPKLQELKSQGLLSAIGVGMNEWEMEERFAREGNFDCFLLAGRYTLLDQSALNSFLPLCEEKGISVIIGGPFNSGILASDLSEGAKYNYENAPKEILAKARRINEICQKYGVPLKAAALQFVLAHPSVASVLSGARSPEEITENFEMIQFPIPAEVWRTLSEQGLIHSQAPLPK
ncbi:MAG: aldo/keto reductase [Thaumarchaeota archaeon]|nr:aldo/keto reductase [Nitrososphaerota archaeon]